MNIGSQPIALSFFMMERANLCSDTLGMKFNLSRVL